MGAGKQQVQSSSSSGCPAGFKVGSYDYILNTSTSVIQVVDMIRIVSKWHLRAFHLGCGLDSIEHSLPPLVALFCTSSSEFSLV